MSVLVKLDEVLTVYAWRLDGGDARHFRGTAETPDGRLICADIHGDQYSDGTVDRYIILNVNAALDPAAARSLAADLLAAAEIDGLNRSENRQ